jgi:hypothetical protein
VEIGSIPVWGQPKQKVSEILPVSNHKLDMVVPVILAIWEVQLGGLRSKISPGQKCETLSKKITNTKSAGSVIQVIDHIQLRWSPEFKSKYCQNQKENSIIPDDSKHVRINAPTCQIKTATESFKKLKNFLWALRKSH